MSPEDLVRRAIAAFNRRDLAGYTELFSPDVVVHDPSFPGPTRGRAALARIIVGTWRSFSDVHWGRDGPVVADGDMVAFALRFDMTQDGPLPMPDGTEFEATGQRISCASAVFWRRDDVGLVVEERSYFDATAVALRLGLVG